MGEIIAVLSGKGGTGKTTVCAGISCALAMQGQRVLVIDCDVGLRNLDIALGIPELGALSFAEVASGQYDLSQATQHPVYPRLRFLTAPAACAADEVDLDAFGKLLQQAAMEFDFILLDAPAGVEAGFQLCAQHADRVILVTGADPASVRDAARAGQLLELMEKIEAKGVKLCYVTLHVGLGTFRPVKCENILDHQMDSEAFEIVRKTWNSCHLGSCRTYVCRKF